MEKTSKEYADIYTNVERELGKVIGKLSYYSIEDFIEDAINYIEAIKERRMICSIGKVSQSGMSRTLKFISCEKNTNSSTYYYRQYNSLFQSLGYKEVKNTDYYRVNGCGMDMIFHTNYTIIKRLQGLGFLNLDEGSNLAQKTPTII